MGKHPDSTDNRILRSIARMEPGTIFTPRHLVSMGSRTAVATALSRQLKAGSLRQPARGFYQVPETHPLLGDLRPSPDQIAKALAGAERIRIQPSGAYAANLLGLSDQVPQRIVYLTDGTPRRVRSGNLEIILRRTTPRNVAAAGRISGLVIQALRHLGRKNVDRRVLETIKNRIGPEDRALLLEDTPLAPEWIAAIMREIARGDAL